MWRPRGPAVCWYLRCKGRNVSPRDDTEIFAVVGGDLFKSPLLNHSNELDVQQSTKLLQNQRKMKYKAAEQPGAPE